MPSPEFSESPQDENVDESLVPVNGNEQPGDAEEQVILASIAPQSVNPYSVNSLPPAPTDSAGPTVETGWHLRGARPRVWTSVAIVGLSLFSILFTSVLMRFVVVWVLHEGPVTAEVFSDLELVQAAFKSRLGLFMLVVVPQLGLVLPSIIAAFVSPVAFRERLSLVRGRWPFWAWIAAAATTPLVGLISTIFLGMFMEESESLREMSEIFREHGRTGFLVPLALMIGATPALCEEVLFRGYVQTRLTLAMRPGMGILVASLLFAVFHMDLVHSIGVLPIGLFLGWITWQSGSLFPAMLGHFVNNSVSVVLMSLAPEGDATTLSMPAVFASLSILTAGFLGTLAVTAAVILYGNPKPTRP